MASRILQSVLHAALQQLHAEIQHAQAQGKTRYDGLPLSPWAFVRCEQAARQSANGQEGGLEAYERACALIRAIRDGSVHEWMDRSAESPNDLVHQALLSSAAVTDIHEREFDSYELRTNATNATDKDLARR